MSLKTLIYSTLLATFILLPQRTYAQYTYSGTPYGGTAWPIPGIIEFENFDNGGQNVAHYDTSNANEGGLYRNSNCTTNNKCVDIGDLPEEGAGGNYSVGWLSNGEWLKYTVNVQEAGPYEIKIRGGMPNFQYETCKDPLLSDGSPNPNYPCTRLQLKLNDQSITSSIDPSTLELYQSDWSWRGYSTIPKPGTPPIIVNLPAGQHVLSVHITTKSGGGSLNYIVFEPANITSFPDIVYPTPGNGQTYYVSPSGNDSNPGSLSQPWKTLTKAANTVTAGSTVYIRAGTYNQRLAPVNSGTPGNYIIFKAYQNEFPIIDGKGVIVPQLEGLVHIENKSYIQISGLTIKDTTTDLDEVISKYWNMGLTIDYSDHIIVDNNKIQRVLPS